MKTMRVRLDDVFPDSNNPRSDGSMGDLEGLADSFKLNAAAPGEPFITIIVVADGNRYRIVDGERRYRAMLLAGTAECNATVCDGYDDVLAITAMLATDDKERLSEADRSRGVQQMLVLGVDYESVERAGRLGKGSAGRIKRGAALAGDKAQQLSLDWLEGLADLEQRGATEKDIAKVRNSKPDRWKAELSNANVRLDLADRRRRFEEACAGLGVHLTDKKPDGYASKIWEWDVERFVEHAPYPEDAVFVFVRSCGGSVEVHVPSKNDGSGESEADAKARIKAEQLMESAKRLSDTAISFAALRHVTSGSTPAMTSSVIERDMGHPGNNWTKAGKVEKAMKLAGVDGDQRKALAPGTATGALGLAYAVQAAELLAFRDDRLALHLAGHSKHENRPFGCEGGIRDFCAVMQAAKADGFGPDTAEFRELINLMTKACDALEGDDAE